MTKTIAFFSAAILLSISACVLRNAVPDAPVVHHCDCPAANHGGPIAIGKGLTISPQSGYIGGGYAGITSVPAIMTIPSTWQSVPSLCTSMNGCLRWPSTMTLEAKMPSGTTNLNLLAPSGNTLLGWPGATNLSPCLKDDCSDLIGR